MIDVVKFSRQIAMALAIISCTFAVISYAAQLTRYLSGHDHVSGLIDLFPVDYEDSLPTVFAGARLGLATLILLTIIALRTCGRSRTPWIVLAIGFAMMTADELVSFHETLSVAQVTTGVTNSSVPLSQRLWVFPALPVVAFLVATFIPFVKRLPNEIRNGMVLSGGLFLGGAVGVEVLELLYADTHGMANLGFQAFATVGELLEMLGIALFIATLLRYIGRHYPTMTLHAPDQPARPIG